MWFVELAVFVLAFSIRYGYILFIYLFHDISNAPIHDVHHIGARSASTHDIIIVQQSSISSQSE